MRLPEAQQAAPLGSAGGSTVRRRDEQPGAAARRFSAKHPASPLTPAPAGARMANRLPA